ncbi:uncharacterized protein [Phaseolus vulgaris]|uniref:RanBP2-type domain-containing protein n=1 Tax=Phaseolus vulgaris TaxID=3885 RepID=V7C6Z8_PHAVU|nr:hypothetical protein PHAVU_003G080000g [Phaseolus vulgaris]ESW25957.1 hypothetical protein PHAVU_003G080000g [Phaseolus vulgaris]
MMSRMPMRLHFSSFPSSPLLINPRKFGSVSIPSLMSWACKKCTFVNPPSQQRECEICLSSASPRGPSSSSSSPPKWSCKACTFLNPYNNPSCEVCATRCPVLSLSNLNDLNDATDHDSSVGSVFFPLQPCNKRKAIDEVHVVEDDDDSSKKVKPFNKAIRTSGEENVELGKACSTFKILSYNVWFREDLELHKRMEAIGDLVQLHSPNFICFQEVTPNIYDIFKQSTWWSVYRCSVSSEMAYSRPYFCMVLSKLPVKSFRNIPFSNSVMGRELCTAEVEAASGKSLVIATSHLESPCPAPPKWDQMFSKERVVQANEAVNLLNEQPNVIFGGDMNWDDKGDGQYPLQDGWTDAWAQLKPNESGWTYDTKANQMLTGNRTLQKRLDRFICHLTDFKITSVDMIGMEVIPGLSYNKEKKVRNGIKQLVLPVLPSDHYGLLLTISSK